jgi:hypothetical protein
MTDASFSKKLLLPLHKMLRPFELLLVLTGVITLFVAAIQYIAVARQIQLIVSIDDKIVYPNENTRDFSLPLSFDNKSANEVWTAEIEILNAGSDFIGEQDSLWRLFVSADNSQFI